jgi:hypothetical protein
MVLAERNFQYSVSFQADFREVQLISTCRGCNGFVSVSEVTGAPKTTGLTKCFRGYHYIANCRVQELNACNNYKLIIINILHCGL